MEDESFTSIDHVRGGVQADPPLKRKTEREGRPQCDPERRPVRTSPEDET